jgi:glycosyl transferase, family 25
MTADPSIFGGVFVVNLARRQDRLADFDKEMARIGLPYERFEAVDNRTNGIGCSLSHLAVLKLAKARGYKNYLVFEDDFSLLVSPEEFWQAMSVMNKPYDVLLLAHCLKESEPFSDRLVKVKKSVSTGAFIVNESMYDKLIAVWEEAAAKLMATGRHWEYACDQSWCTLQAEAAWYAFVPKLGKQRPSWSDLGQYFYNGDV